MCNQYYELGGRWRQEGISKLPCKTAGRIFDINSVANIPVGSGVKTPAQKQAFDGHLEVTLAINTLLTQNLLWL